MRVRSLVAASFALLVTTSHGAIAGRFESIVVHGVITQNPSANGSTTVDTKGLFASAGTDLAGAKIEILQQYEPEHFGPPEGDGNSAVIYQAKTPNSHLPGTILITVNVNGNQRVFTSDQSGSIITGSVYPYSISQIEADKSDGQYTVHLAFADPVHFGLPFPTQSVVKIAVVHDFTFYPTDHSAGEYLSFTVRSASH